MSDLNKLFPNIPLNLEILAEECAEVIQIKSKIIRFGLHDFHPKEREPNRNILVKELGDVLAMVEILKANKVINQVELDWAIKAKLDKLPKWYK